MGHAVRLGALLHHFPGGADLICCVDGPLASQHFPEAAQFRRADRDTVNEAVSEGVMAGDLTVLVVDLPQHDLAYWRLGSDRVLTIAIDDKGGFGIAADIVVNQSDIAGTAPYPDLPPHALVLRGLRCALLRQAFSAPAAESFPRSGVGFVAGSGEYSDAWIADVVRNLETESMGPVSIVISTTHPSRTELMEIGAARAIDVATGLSPERMCEFYRRLDLCAMTGGTAIFEAMSTGTPVLCYPILDDMLQQTQLLSSLGGVIALPRSQAGTGAIEKAVREVLSDRTRLRRVGATARSLVDGQGCVRVAALIGGVIDRWLSGCAKSEAVAMGAVA